MKESGTSILPGLILIVFVACAGVGAHYFLGTNLLFSALIGLGSFFVIIKIGDIISEASRDKQHDSDIEFIFTKSCRKCGRKLIDCGQVQGLKPPFKVHCNNCGHDAFVDEHYDIHV